MAGFTLSPDQVLLGYHNYLLAIGFDSIGANNKPNFALIKLDICPNNAFLRAGVSKKLNNFSSQNVVKAEICNNTNFRIPIFNNIGNQTCLLETRACTQIEQNAWSLAAKISHRYAQNLMISSVSSIQRSPIEYVTCNIHDLYGKVSLTKKWASWELSQSLTMDFNLDAYMLNKTNVFSESDLYLTSTIKYENKIKKVFNVMKLIIKPLKKVSKVNVSLGFDTGFIEF